MSEWNSGSEEYKPKTVVIFNNGVAGGVDNVTVTVTKDLEANGENKRPVFSIIFTDEKGATTNQGWWLQKQDDEEKGLKKNITKLRAILEATGFSGTYPSGNSYDELLGKLLKLIGENAKGKKFRVWANYGTTQGPKPFIQVRNWSPCMELMGTTPTTLEPANIEVLQRPTPDGGSDGSALMDTPGVSPDEDKDPWDTNNG